MPDQCLTFLKLGGSLITDKDQPETALIEQIDDLLTQIAEWRLANPSQRLLLGHGSGSFGHHVATQYGTRQGFHGPEDILGFQQVWYSARKLNQIIIEQAQLLNLPLIAFPPSACITAAEGLIREWNLRPLFRVLSFGLIPIVYGDVAIDVYQGGTILSTEDLFGHLAVEMGPDRILLAGRIEGVYADFPENHQLLPHLSAHSNALEFLQGSASQDVTGGMVTKVQSMQALCRRWPNISVQIFSAVSPGSLRLALDGAALGTIIN
ncbi:MAG TPA: isopentenyl phosphate kinase [Anaerolineaceae bacterium]|nr:isopentenyl phosphate kinase [Anaerolineaceae bacterium]